MASIHALPDGPGECERPYRYPARAPFELLRQPRRAEPRRPCEARMAPGLADFKSGAGDIAPREQGPRQVQASSEQSPEMLEVFRDEAQEHLATITDGIRALERSPGDLEAINAIRRATKIANATWCAGTFLKSSS